MPITSQQVQAFQTRGYTTAPSFFNREEVDAFRADLDRLKRAGKLRNVVPEANGDDRVNLQLCPMSPHSTLIRALPYCEKVQEAITALIGDPYVLHLDQTFVKPGGHGMGTNWHQDNAYFKIDNPLMGTAMWIAVHDATIENGTIHVIPDCFDKALPHDRDPMSDHHIRCWPDESREVAFELPAGGVAFFCYGTPHATKANTSAHERAGIAMHFLRQDQIRDDMHATGFGSKPILTGARATGGQREYGVTVAGTWQQEVRAALDRAPAAV